MLQQLRYFARFHTVLRTSPVVACSFAKNVTVATNKSEILQCIGPQSEPIAFMSNKRETHGDTNKRGYSTESKTTKKAKKTASSNEAKTKIDADALDRQYNEFVEQNVKKLQAEVRTLHRQGSFNEAIKSAEKCVELVERHFGTQTPVYASSMNNVAILNKTLGNLELACVQYGKTVQAYADSVGMHHPSTGVALHNLAICIKTQAANEKGLARQALLEEAKGVFEDAIMCHNKAIQRGAPTNNLILTQATMASILREMGKNKEAQKMLLKSIEMLEESNADVLTRATVMNNLGYHYKMVGNLKEALKLYTAACELRGKVLAPDHPDSIASLNNIAELFSALGNEKMERKTRLKIIDIVNASSATDAGSS